MERFEKSKEKKHQFFWYDKNTVRTTSNQPSVPCFKPLLRREGRVLLHVALSRWDFSTFTWLYVNVLTEIVLISRSLFNIVEPEVSF